ncbi:NAD-dependent epimerase/dehydratase family protein [Rhizosphaericola mali]|uniref:NAD-dependent epimerase/dehydratase family protein n=2 Tax=Rhizosphaericola mali TaxID=2545455 RepID=A0A5P2GAD3_9BACT|nr:NAD-dependent epimerase/dehydratase family protein [Rhizosphaericola mali]
MEAQKVLLTGITGFLGCHTAIKLLEKGYKVVGTFRDQKRLDATKQTISRYTDKLSNLSFVETNLLDENQWYEITKYVDFVQHIASPFSKILPKDENELIRPAKKGTLSIMDAASKNGVKRVVMTSALGAICYGKTNEELQSVFDEKDWTNIANLDDTTPYYRSKTIAEKTAWDFLATDKSGLELTTVCPSAILGPVFENDYGASVNIIVSLLNGSTPVIPKIEFDIVDVRSVADLLILAMELPQAANNRYIAAATHFTYKEIAKILKVAYPKRTIPTIELPNSFSKLLSFFMPILRPVLLENKVRKIDASKATKELDWTPLSGQEAILSCAKSLFDLEVVK